MASRATQGLLGWPAIAEDQLHGVDMALVKSAQWQAGVPDPAKYLQHRRRTFQHGAQPAAAESGRHWRCKQSVNPQRSDVLNWKRAIMV